MPFIRKVHVLFKTRLIFSRINGPIKSVGEFVFFRISYFDYSDLQLFTIFIFEVDFSETYLMANAENSVLEPPNLKNFPQTPLQGSCLRQSR